MTAPRLSAILAEFLRLPTETEWVEFKHNNTDPEMIGEYLSALANSAALTERTAGYLIWGNASLRERLKIAKSNYPLASRIIRDAIDEGLVRPVAGIGKEYGYVPFWA